MPLGQLARLPAGAPPAGELRRALRTDAEPVAVEAPGALDEDEDEDDDDARVGTARAWTRYLQPAAARAAPAELDEAARDELYRSLTSTAPSVPSASTGQRRTLREGDRGPEVTELQALLAQRGHHAGGSDGVFGGRTGDAVMGFQSDNGLAADGVVGPRTWAKLLAASAPTPVGPVPAPSPGAPPQWSFDLDRVPGSYDARAEVTATYDIGGIIDDVPGMWNRRYASDVRAEFRDDFEALGGRSDETYGQLFRRVGAELGVDPHALAAYSVFESYNGQTGSFNPHMKEVAGSMYAAGLAATQAQHVRGTQVPGLDRSLPSGLDDAAWSLRASPELGVRFLAAEMKAAYEQKGDLARAFPYVAFPAWGDPDRSRGAYGTQAEYVSRAKAVYDAFAAVDR